MSVSWLYLINGIIIVLMICDVFGGCRQNTTTETARVASAGGLFNRASRLHLRLTSYLKELWHYCTCSRMFVVILTALGTISSNPSFNFLFPLGFYCICVSLYIVFCLHNAIEEFNMDSEGDCGQRNLAHITRNKKSIKKELL